MSSIARLEEIRGIKTLRKFLSHVKKTTANFLKNMLSPDLLNVAFPLFTSAAENYQDFFLAKNSDVTATCFLHLCYVKSFTGVFPAGI